MNSTHYMSLLASNQPWNLLLFMAVPVICAETLAITEFMLLYTRNHTGVASKINRFTGIFAGLYFSIIFLYLSWNAAIPLTMNGDWKGPFDVIAVLSYMAGVVPFFGLFLLEVGILKKNSTPKEKIKTHAILVSIFLVVAHIAMIFGMLNPDLLATTSMHHMSM